MLPSQLLQEQVSVCTGACGARLIVGQWLGGYSRKWLSLDSYSFSIWYGVQASIGGSCVLVMLRSIWPSVQNIRKPAHTSHRSSLITPPQQTPCRPPLVLQRETSCASSYSGLFLCLPSGSQSIKCNYIFDLLMSRKLTPLEAAIFSP